MLLGLSGRVGFGLGPSMGWVRSGNYCFVVGCAGLRFFRGFGWDSTNEIFWCKLVAWTVTFLLPVHPSQADFSSQRCPQNSTAAPSTGAPIACGVGKNGRFSTNDSLYLENDKDKRIVSIKVEYEFCRTVTLPVTLSASRLNAQVYYTLVDYNRLIPLLFQFVLDLLYKLSLHCCAAVGKILSDTWRRAVRLQ